MGGAQAKAGPDRSKAQDMLEIAAQRGDANGIKNALSLGAQINASKSSDNMTPLHLAAQRAVFRQNIDYLEALLAAGANVSLADSHGRFPLHLAQMSVEDTPIISAQPAVDAMRLLIKKGADVNAALPTGETVLHIAARLGHFVAVEMLLEEGGNPNLKTTSGCNALGCAVDCLRYDITERLLKAGTSIDTLAMQYSLCVPLLDAVVCHTRLCEMIAPLAEDKLRTHLDKDGRTYLWTASSEALPLLLKIGLNVHHRDALGRTVLYRRWRSKQDVHLLIDSGVDVNVQDNEGMTILHLICGCDVNPMETRRDDQELMQPLNFFLSVGADPTIQNKTGKLPIDLAIAMGNKFVVNRLSSMRPSKVA